MTDKLTLIDWDRYKVRENGDVIVLSGRNAGQKLTKGVHVQGYHIVSLRQYDSSRFLKCYLHRVVAYHFLDNPDNLPQINHIDGDKQNNDVSNLEWCTPKENVRHAIETGLFDNVKVLGAKGQTNPNSKLTEDDVQHIRWLATEGIKAIVLAKEWDVSQASISNILAGKTWAHI
jgi:hypothetical protein